MTISDDNRRRFTDIRRQVLERGQQEDEFCKNATTETVARLLFRISDQLSETHKAVLRIDAEIRSLKLRLPE